MEPWISVAQKMGLRILIESHSTRSEAAGDDLDGPTLAAMFRAQARAVKCWKRIRALTSIISSRRRAVCWSRASSRPGAPLHAPPTPYTRERFDDTYNWTVEVEHGRARRHLRERRRQPRLGVSAALSP